MAAWAWTPFGTIYADGVSSLKKQGYRLDNVKQWRQERHDQGLPSGLNDFYEAHGFCMGCHGAGRTITGCRWRDREYYPQSVQLVEGGQHTIASLVENEMKDAVAWDYTYAECEWCKGTGLNKNRVCESPESKSI